VNADGETRQRTASGAASDFLAGEIGGAEGGSGVSGDGLHVDVVERAECFEGADQKDVQEDATGKTEATGASLLLKICCELEDDFLEAILGAAGEIGAKGGSEGEIAGSEAKFAVKSGREDSVTVRTGGEVAAIESWKTTGAPGEEFAEGGEKFGFAVLAKPLELVFITARAEAGEFGDSRIEPAEGIGKFEGLQGLDFVGFAEGNEAGVRGCALVEGENEGAVETGRVIGAGGVAEVMVELGGPRTAAEELAKLVVGGGRLGTPGAFGGVLVFGMTLGDGNGTAIREFQMIFGKTSLEGQARNIKRVLEAVEFFFLDGEQDRGFVEQSDRGTAADGGDAEEAHGEAAHGVPWKASAADSTGAASSGSLPAWVTIASRNWLGGSEAGKSTVR
jgi:hypothetical protein